MRLGGIVLATILFAGACSSEPEPKEPPKTSTPATSPTTAAPRLPDQATEDSPEGAAAFVQYYIDVFNHAARTGDVEALAALSSPDCAGCQRYISLYRDTYAAGGYFRGGEWESEGFDVRLHQTGATVFTDVTSPAGTYRLRKGDSPSRGNAENSSLTFKLIRAGEKWSLAVFELQATE